MQLCTGKVPNIYLNLGVDEPVGEGKVHEKILRWPTEKLL